MLANKFNLESESANGVSKASASWSSEVLRYRPVWRGKTTLIICPLQCHPYRQSISAVIESDRDRLLACLKRSPTRVLLLDSAIGEKELELWSDLGREVKKPVYLRLRSLSTLPSFSRPFAWLIKSSLDRLVAFVCLVLLSPVLLAIAMFVNATTEGPVFCREWCVGQRGRLFRRLKFRCTYVKDEIEQRSLTSNQVFGASQKMRLTPLGAWMQQFGLDALPQLINVLQGEMSIVGPRPWGLHDAAGHELKRLNALPGVIGPSQVEGWELGFDLVDCAEMELVYLEEWSLLIDLRYLLRTIPITLSRGKAY